MFSPLFESSGAGKPDLLKESSHAHRQLAFAYSKVCEPYYETHFDKFNRLFRYFQEGPEKRVKVGEHYTEEERLELLAWGSQAAYGNVDEVFGPRPHMPNENWFPWTAHELGTPFRDLQRKWDRWFLVRCTTQDYARIAYCHYAEEIMKRNNLDYLDPKKAEKEKSWTECVKEEREKNPGYTDNDILIMKLTQIDYLAQVSQTFTAGLDEYDIEMRDVHMVWYILGALVTIAVFIPLLIVLCKYAQRLRALELARRKKMEPQELEVFDKDFLAKFREQARQRYLKYLEEKKQKEQAERERQIHLASIQEIRNQFRKARAQNFTRRTNLTIVPADLGKKDNTKDSISPVNEVDPNENVI